MNNEFEFILWCSVDLEEILQDNRRRTPMNADFIPDKLWSIAIYDDQDRFRPDILTVMNYDKYWQTPTIPIFGYDKLR